MGIKTRKHHNNRGSKQIRHGKTIRQVVMMARKMNLRHEMENNICQRKRTVIGILKEVRAV